MSAYGRVPDFATTTRLFARALGISPETLMASFRQAVPEDLPAIVEFRSHSGWDDRAYLTWRYGLGGEANGGGSELWLVQQGTEIRGLIGRESQPILCNGRVMDGQLLMDIQLDRAAEGAGGGAWLNQAMFGKADVSLAVGANPNSLGLVKRMFAPLPPRLHYTLPLDITHMLRRRNLPPMLARVLGALMVSVSQLRARWLGPRRVPGINVRELPRMTDALLTEMYSGLAPDLKVVAPSAKHLNWRLLDNPRACYRIFGAFDEEGCIAYAAARIVEDEEAPAMHLIDWKCHAGQAGGAMRALVDQLLDIARTARCTKVYTTLLDSADDVLLQRLGFMRGRASPYYLNGVHAQDPTRTLALASRNWRISDLSFDNDGGY